MYVNGNGHIKRVRHDILWSFWSFDISSAVDVFFLILFNRFEFFYFCTQCLLGYAEKSRCYCLIATRYFHGFAYEF